MSLASDIRHSFRVLQKAGMLALAPMLLDALFLLLLGFVLSGAATALVGYLSAAGLEIASGGVSGSLLIAGLIYVLTAAAVYAVYSVLHGSAWWLCHRMQGSRTSYHAVLRSFSLVSALWAGVFMVLHALNLVVEVAATARALAVPAAGYAFSAAMLCLGYAAAVSYALLSPSARQTLSAARKTALKGPSLLAGAVVALYFGLLSLGLSQLAAYPLLLALLQLFVAVPSLTAARVFLILRIRRIS